MKSAVSIRLTPTPEQKARLVALQAAFAQVCNALAPMVSQTRVWNRVALHHLAYKGLREQFPALGSQLVCNAIYAVSRTSRLLFQAPGSPLHHTRFSGKPLPQLRFADTCPVYLDRNTLSLKQGQASIYTLDGRMRFELALAAGQEQAFHTRKLLEVALWRREGEFELKFVFDEPAGDAAATATATEDDAEDTTPGQALPPPALPDYVMVQEAA
jgi:hypothetical protein